MTQLEKNPPAMQETWVQSLDLEEPLQKGMATLSSIVPGKCYGQRSQMGRSPRIEHDLATKLAATPMGEQKFTTVSFNGLDFNLFLCLYLLDNF